LIPPYPHKNPDDPTMDGFSAQVSRFSSAGSVVGYSGRSELPDAEDGTETPLLMPILIHASGSSGFAEGGRIEEVKVADTPISVRISPQNIVANVKTVRLEGRSRKTFSVDAGAKIRGMGGVTVGEASERL
jgi:hypothetical protein